MPTVRQPAVAGLFYPERAAALRRTVGELLAAASTPAAARPRALIAPHAGYVYSGGAAAAAYGRLGPWRSDIERVILLGPPHRVPVGGAATASWERFATPLGEIEVDRGALAAPLASGAVAVGDAAHAPEHALEVQLPFLQSVLERFALVPLLIGDLDAAAVAALIEPWWDDERSLIVVSTDLSHYLDYAAARAVDAATDRAISALDPGVIGPAQACGCRALNGLLHLARERGADIERLALCNSGDTAGPADRVVGYAAYTLT